ncbi:DUF4362 domain-containing protein [Micromonospora sp. MS34]|uniref:DUF4362 domain-containing protein n=1 Tax=Micromonospora sp. MS34 TaxID=3385971 RepID=UPI0039A14B48
MTVLALSLTPAACGTTDPDAVPPDPPQAHATRSPARPDCGVWTLGQGDRLPTEAAECLDGALRDGQEARMRVIAPTIEGGPITTDYLVRVDGRVEVIADGRRDRYGAGRIERRICTGPVSYTPVPSFPTCSTPTPV